MSLRWHRNNSEKCRIAPLLPFPGASPFYRKFWTSLKSIHWWCFNERYIFQFVTAQAGICGFSHMVRCSPRPASSDTNTGRQSASRSRLAGDTRWESTVNAAVHVTVAQRCQQTQSPCAAVNLMTGSCLYAISCWMSSSHLTISILWCCFCRQAEL